MSLTTPLPSPGLVPALASSWPGAGPSPEVVARLASIAALRGTLAAIELDERGHVVHSQIVPPTSQNQGAIEADLAAFAPSVLDLPQAEAVHRLEMLIRAYDPCISCATHFLDLRIVEDGA
jgi:sulfhydrogenase subunit alpha